MFFRNNLGASINLIGIFGRLAYCVTGRNVNLLA